MNLLKKISLVYTLQVSAVVVIFAYPGCSSTIAENQNKTTAEKSAIELHGISDRPLVNTGHYADSAAGLIQTQITPVFISIKPGK